MYSGMTYGDMKNLSWFVCLKLSFHSPVRPCLAKVSLVLTQQPIPITSGVINDNDHRNQISVTKYLTNSHFNCCQVYPDYSFCIFISKHSRPSAGPVRLQLLAYVHKSCIDSLCRCGTHLPKICVKNFHHFGSQFLCVHFDFPKWQTRQDRRV